MSNSSRRDDRKAAQAEKQQRALVLRRAGATYEQIGQQLGTDAGTAHRLVSSAIAAIPKEEAKAVLSLELERLDLMLRGGLLERAQGGDVQAIDRVIRIMERRAAYLGIDAPKRTQAEVAADVTVTDGGHASVIAKLDALARAAGAGEADSEPERSGDD